VERGTDTADSGKQGTRYTARGQHVSGAYKQ